MPDKLSFIQPEQVKAGRSKGQRYAAYAQALVPHLDEIKTGIEESPGHNVIVKTDELVKLMGMTSRDPKSIYWAVKYVMWTEGVALSTATHKDGSHLLIFREPKEGETLPASMLRYDTEVEDELGI